MIPVHTAITNHFPVTNSEFEGLATTDIKRESHNITLPSQNFAISRNSMMISLPSRRGRRSTIPPEIREEVRRLKKRNTERQRRACISDKMNALHSLAMKLIGEDPSKHSKMEKNDILGICYTIFEGIAKILKDRPELLSRLHNLGSTSQETMNAKPISHSSDSMNLQPNDSNSSSKYFHKTEQNSIQTNLPNPSTYSSTNINPLQNQKMKQHSNPNSSIPLSCSNILNERKSSIQCVNTQSKTHTFRLPLKYRWCKVENQNTTFDFEQINHVNRHNLSFEMKNRTNYIHTLVKSEDNFISKPWTDDQKENISHYINQENVWRPYLN
ncbi:unnamed protein product [Schistosoma turkestanicum]|nr:unnamed protein product [Schistosoma turkestanicum]